MRKSEPSIMTEQTNALVGTIVGRVVSNKMNKTIVVQIDRKVPHPKYGKYVSRKTKRFAHDENNICQIGDVVSIKETRPISKNKSCVLVEVIQKTAQK